MDKIDRLFTFIVLIIVTTYLSVLYGSITYDKYKFYKKIETYGKAITTSDGTTFQQALMAMAHLESRDGKYLIGDAYKYKYFVLLF